MFRFICASALLWGGVCLPAGDLTPPGAPAPTAGPEARTAVNTLSGSATIEHIIDEPGSYYLSGNIVVTREAYGIGIRSSDVTIDLNGHTVSNAGSGERGIDTDAANLRNLEVSNGFVSGWLTLGVRLGADNSVIRRVRATDNERGILVGDGGLVEDCVVSGSLFTGIGSGFGSLVINSSATNCGVSFSSPSGSGFEIGQGGGIFDSVAHSNPGYGFDLRSSTLIAGCTATDNTVGIRYRVGCAVIGNTVSDSGDIADIRRRGIDDAGTVNGALIRGNQVSKTNIGIFARAGTVVIQNTARDGDRNYVLTEAPIYGPVITDTGVITNDNPWGNISQ